MNACTCYTAQPGQRDSHCPTHGGQRALGGQQGQGMVQFGSTLACEAGDGGFDSPSPDHLGRSHGINPIRSGSCCLARPRLGPPSGDGTHFSWRG